MTSPLRGVGVKDEKFQYYGDSLKNPIFRDGVHKNPIYRGELPQRGREGGGDSLQI